ncbi:MAG TPA: hypothetical protein VNO22_11425 [Planctomycetota bacterium]|jgi:hypothetical protein|nr:hypothetical protein [Planctomycetota bacterium]
MSGRTKFLIALLVAGVTFHQLKERSGRLWGRSGAYPVLQKHTGGARVGDIHSFRVTLEAPPEEKQFRELEVPDTAFEKLLEGDLVSFDVRRLPFLGLDLIEFEAVREGRTVVAWKEGFPIFWFGMAGVALGAGGAAALVLTLLLLALGYGRAPKD